VLLFTLFFKSDFLFVYFKYPSPAFVDSGRILYFRFLFSALLASLYNCSDIHSLNKIPRKRPTFNALLEHPWLLPLSPSRPDFKQIEETNRSMLGKWVRTSLAEKNLGKDSDIGTEERVKPPLHAVVKDSP